MRLNSWRVAGGICRKRRPGGKETRISPKVPMIYSCPESCGIYVQMCSVSLLFFYFSLKLAVQEDLDEERKEEEERKKSAKRKKNN